MGETGTLRAGVVGVGHLGRLHAMKYAASGAVAGKAIELAAVYDVETEVAGRVAAEFGCEPSTSLEDLLGRVDCLSVAVPASAHLEVGLRVAEAGVHMLVEKPVAPDVAGTRRLAEAAQKAGVILQAGHLERFNPVLGEVQNLLRAPRFVECHRLSPYAGRGADADVIVDVMIHDLDLLAFLVGEPVVDVEAVGVPILSSNVDIANARIRFAGGCVANLTASRVSLKRERKMRIFQEDAYVSLDFDARRATIARKPDRDGLAATGSGPEGSAAAAAASADKDRTRHGPDHDDPMSAIEVETRELADGDPLAAEIAAFLEAVATGGRPPVGAEEAVCALEIAAQITEAVRRSSAEAR